MAETVDSIVAATIDNLCSQGDLVRRMDEAIESMARARARIAAARTRFHLRSNTTATINKTQAATTTFSIRAGGVECGTVQIGPSGSAEFKISKVNSRFAEKGAAVREWAPWSSTAVREYLDQCDAIAADEFKDLEQRVQAEFLDVMLGRTTRAKTQLRGFQPVTLAGVPIQMPTPVKPRGSNVSGALGHLDVLARHGQGHLAVFELKQPRRGAGRCALRQAIAYAASVEWLMRRMDIRPRYWAAIGSRRTIHAPTMHAYAVVTEADGCDLIDEWMELEAGNAARYQLGVYAYSRESGKLAVSALAREAAPA